jgi:hypothetical protein
MKKVLKIIGIIIGAIGVLAVMMGVFAGYGALIDDYIDSKIEKINIRNAQQKEEITIPLVKIEPIKESDIKIPDGCKTRLRMVATTEEFLRYFNSLTRDVTSYQVVITGRTTKRDTTKVEWTIYYKLLQPQTTN